MEAQLNSSQQAAVECLSGRLLITAGAGSGKTRTLAERFAHAVEAERESGAERPTERILTITFTDKAAGELAERVRGALRARGLSAEARAVDSAWISTIHGFCTRLLRREAIAAGIDPGFAMLEESHSFKMQAEAFERALASLEGSANESVSRVLDTYGFAVVRTAVLQLARYLRARGMEPGELALADDDDVSSVWGEARTLFSALSDAFSQHEDALTSAVKHRCACDSVLECIGALDVSAGDPADMAQELWMALAGYGAPMTRAKATTEAVELLKTRKSALIGRCARIMTHPLERGLLDLTVVFLAEHRAAKSGVGVLDFDDLIGMTRDLLERRPDVLSAYRKRFSLSMVDEFQDTDTLQLALIEAIAGDDLATVGDVRQSIYSFRGADVEVYRRHRKEMVARGAVSLGLERNYRSHRDIIAFVNATFGSDVMFGAEGAGLEAAREDSEPPRVGAESCRVELAVVDSSDGMSTAEAVAVEASILAERFAALREQGFSPEEMVVLVRRYRDAPVFADALEAVGLSTMIVGGNRFFGLCEVAALRALCAVIGDPHDDEALVSLLISDLSGMEDGELSELGFDADGARRRGSLWDTLVRVYGLPEARDEAGGKVLTCIENARMRAPTDGLAVALHHAIRESGLDRVLMSRGAAGRLAWANVVKFVRKAAAFERAGGSGPLEFAEALDAEEAAGQRESPEVAPGSPDGSVTVMSIHAAKGLEFPVVAVPALGVAVPRVRSSLWRAGSREGRLQMALQLPRSMAPRSDESVVKTPLFAELDERARADAFDEAKRLLYVACTRAEEVLVMSGSADPDMVFNDDKDTPLAWLARANEGALRPHVDARQSGVVGIGGAQAALTIRQPTEVGVSTASEARLQERARPAGRPRVAPWRPESSAPVSPVRISYSDISLYERCTLRYWAERVAGLRGIADRERNDATARGTALHAALSLTDEAGRPPSPERAKLVAAGHGLDEAEQDAIAAIVARYADSARARDVARWPNVRREVPFAVRVGGGEGAERRLLLVGALDVYAREGGAALIVDHKSGLSGTADELVARYRLQAECYAYVALKDGARRVEVRFARPEVIDDAGQPQEVGFEFDGDDIERIERRLTGVWTRMGAEPYVHLGAWDFRVCPGCPASGSVCALTAPKRGAD